MLFIRAMNGITYRVLSVTLHLTFDKRYVCHILSTQSCLLTVPSRKNCTGTERAGTLSGCGAVHEASAKGNECSLDPRGWDVRVRPFSIPLDPEVPHHSCHDK